MWKNSELFKKIAHQYDKNGKYDWFLKQIYSPTVKRLDDQCDHGVDQNNVPRIEKSVVESVHISKAENKPVEGICSDHARLQDIEKC